MPEEKPVETTEKPAIEEKPEKVEPEKPVEPSKEEKDKEFQQKIEKADVKTRFPKKEQTPQEKEEGYWKRQAKKLKEKLEKGETLEDDELLDEDEKPITRKEFNQMIEESNKKQSSENMLQEFLTEKPEYRKFAPLLRKHLNDPAYANIPIGFIANGIMGEYGLDDEINERAELKRKADEEALNSKAGGSSKRTVPGKKKNVWDMSKEEFEQHQADILRGK